MKSSYFETDHARLAVTPSGKVVMVGLLNKQNTRVGDRRPVIGGFFSAETAREIAQSLIAAADAVDNYERRDLRVGDRYHLLSGGTAVIESEDDRFFHGIADDGTSLSWHRRDGCAVDGSNHHLVLLIPRA